MRVIYPPELIASLRNKHLLLDTNIFRDFAVNPTIFSDFFDTLKKSDITLATIDLVKFELLKGSAAPIKYEGKERLVQKITDVTVPSNTRTTELVFRLIQEYGINGASLSIVDLYLGAMLMQYGQNIFLLSRDTTDFIQRVFNLVCVVNVTHAKGIFTYGIYQYKNKDATNRED